MHSFSSAMLSLSQAPEKIRTVDLPRREDYYPSPQDWRDQILYFLLPDRFSNDQEKPSNLLDRNNLGAARPAGWTWEKWAESGKNYWQGGTIQGIKSKLDYLKGLGITALWIGPLFKQRWQFNTYHGYGIQDFLEVDPHFGSRQDLVVLVEEAHKKGIRIILDIIFNHSGSNFFYPGAKQNNCPNCADVGQAEYKDYHSQDIYYQNTEWYNQDGQGASGIINDRDDAVWPQELQNMDYYSRAGTACDLSGDICDEHAVLKRSDFCNLRDFKLEDPNHDALNDLARCYKYWIALTDCDGFRIDTLKHVSLEQAQIFCNAIKEYAANLGKKDFFLVGEVSGGDYEKHRYINVLSQNINAALDIGDMVETLRGVAKGFFDPNAYFKAFKTENFGTNCSNDNDHFPGNPFLLGSHRALGKMHVSVIDDHDNIFADTNIREKLRFTHNFSYDQQVVAAVALQLFTLGIPCIYYGTEQAFCLPDPQAAQLNDYGRKDYFLREAMFGPDYPKKSERVSGSVVISDDPSSFGFGPFGTSGKHCFDQNYSVYRIIAQMAATRQGYPALRYGRQYLRDTIPAGKPDFGYYKGEITAWSRILADEEFLCVVNTNGDQPSSADITVDKVLSPPGSELTVLLNTDQIKTTGYYSGPHPAGSKLKIQEKKGHACIEVKNLPKSAVLVLTNHP